MVIDLPGYSDTFYVNSNVNTFVMQHNIYTAYQHFGSHVWIWIKVFWDQVNMDQVNRHNNFMGG